MRSAQALECKLIVPVRWVRWNGNTNLFEQLSINKILGEKKILVLLFSALALWRKLSPNGLLTLTTVCASRSTCFLWLPSYLLIVFCPSFSIMHAGLFSSDSPSLVPSLQTFWTCTWKWILAENFHGWVFRNFSIRKTSFTFFLYFVVRGLVFVPSPPCPCRGVGEFCFSILSYPLGVFHHKTSGMFSWKPKFCPPWSRLMKDKEGRQELLTLMA